MATPSNPAAAPSGASAASPAPYYLRTALVDRPGSLARIATVLGDNGVSIDRMRQYAHDAPHAPVLIVTHRTSRGALDAAIEAMDAVIAVDAETFDREQASASTWIFRIARNRRIDAARRAAKPELDASDPALSPPEPESPDAAALSRERSTRVGEAMADLPEEQIALLRLAFFDGLSHRDIAERIGVPLGTVKSRLRLAFDKLRKRLDPGDL